MKPVRVLVVDDSATMRGLIAHAAAAAIRRSRWSARRPIRWRRAGDQGAQSRRHHPRHRDAEHERARFPREDHAAAADAGDHGLEPDPAGAPTPPSPRSNWAPSTASAKPGVRAAATSLRRTSPGQRQGGGGAGAARIIERSHRRRRAGAAPLSPAMAAWWRSARRPAASRRCIAVLSHFRANCPPTVITQHMPAAFTQELRRAPRPRSATRRSCEAFDGAPLEPGQVYLAPGGAAHLERRRRRAGALPPAPRRSRQRPPAFGRRAVRLGRQGRRRARRRRHPDRHGPRRRRGPARHAQGRRDDARPGRSQLPVYGMPKAAFEIGAVEKQVPLYMVASEILRGTCAASLAPLE